MSANNEKQKEFQITRETLENVINFLLEESDFYKEEISHQKYIIEEQKKAIELLFLDHEDLIDKYEDLFETMMMEEDTVDLRAEIIRLKDSLKLAESLIDFKDSKNKNKK